MNLTDAQASAEVQVSAAANVLEAAREQLREAVFDALEAGVPVLRIANATGIARTTILRWEAEAA